MNKHSYELFVTPPQLTPTLALNAADASARNLACLGLAASLRMA